MYNLLNYLRNEMKSITVKLPTHLDDKLEETLKRDNLTLSQYIHNLIEHDLNSRVYLGEGFYYHRYLDKLFDNNDKTIHLSKIEKEMLVTLIEHEGEFASVDILTIRAWKKDEVSIYTFRNMIKKIRDKTYYGIIKNRSNIGYSINMKVY